MVMLPPNLLYTEIDFCCCSKGFLVMSTLLNLHLILKRLILEAVR